LAQADELFQVREATLRWTKYIADRERGLSPEVAQYEQKVLIRYDWASPMDQLLRNSILPFWMWKKGLAISVWGAFRRNPAWALAFVTLPHLGAWLWNWLFFPDEEDRLQADKRGSKKYIARQTHFFTGTKWPTGKKDEFGKDIMADVLMFDQLPDDEVLRSLGILKFEDIARRWMRDEIDGTEALARTIFALPSAMGEEILEAVGPVKMPAELHTNLNWFYRVPIYHDSDPELVKRTKQAHYVIRTFDRNISTIESLIYSSGSPYANGLRFAFGLPLISADISENLTTQQLMEKSITAQINKNITKARRAAHGTRRDWLPDTMRRFMGAELPVEAAMRDIDDAWENIRSLTRDLEKVKGDFPAKQRTLRSVKTLEANVQRWKRRFFRGEDETTLRAAREYEMRRFGKGRLPDRHLEEVQRRYGKSTTATRRRYIRDRNLELRRELAEKYGVKVLR
jgi:hypothetical protein